jgi:hypothetical protein
MVQHHNLCGMHDMVADPEVPVTVTGRHQGVLVLTPATALSGWAAYSDTIDCSDPPQLACRSQLHKASFRFLPSPFTKELIFFFYYRTDSLMALYFVPCWSQFLNN